jgi:hypothetical protein
MQMTPISVNTIADTSNVVPVITASNIYSDTSWVANNTLQVTGDAIIDGTLTVNGTDIAEVIQKIQDRLNILVPDPKKLAKYEALKQAYDHYKMIEQLIGDE